MAQPTGDDVKARKVTDKDFKKIEQILKNELDKRKGSQYRQSHERKWKEVDRQVILDPANVFNMEEESWANAFEIGELARASEVMTADFLRVVFPEMRSWFEAHIELETDISPVDGQEVKPDKKYQNKVDGRLRAMMTQQHKDFGLRERVELSIKEALHHGAFVAEVKEESMSMYFDGVNVKTITSPVWVPHSMWNCYPDPSPSLVGSNMFYNGSMLIKEYAPRHKFIESTGTAEEGWIPKNIKRIPKRENQEKDVKTKDLEIVKYWGDIVIPKGNDITDVSGEDMYFPNMKAILANGKLVYLDSIKTPYPPIVFKGYEKMDSRDPYFMSPLIKQSPIQKIASILANEFVNGVQLRTRPPITYDGNDPDFVVNGGPVIAPGAKTSTKGSSNYKVMEVGDPSSTLTGLEYMISSMKESLGRPGVEVGNRATRTEVVTKQADSEAGPFGFATKIDEALRTFLYMQHYMNKKKKGFVYSYYNPELDSPDFLRVTGDELPDTVNFEVVGSKGMLGEERRHAAFVQSTAFLAGNPLFAPLLETMDVAKQIYMDAGVKGPERFLKQGDIPPDLQAKFQQMQQALQQMAAQLKDAEQQNSVKMDKAQMDFKAKEDKIHATHVKDMANIAQKHASETNRQQASVENAVLRAEQMVRDLEHKIELMMHGNDNTNSELASDGSEIVHKRTAPIDRLSDMHKQNLQAQSEVAGALKELANTVGKKKKVVRDESGRIAGVE